MIGAKKKIVVMACTMLPSDFVGDGVDTDIGVVVGEGVDSEFGVAVGDGASVGGASGQGVSSGSTSVTVNVGGTTKSTDTSCSDPGIASSSNVPTMVAAKPCVKFPVPSHVPQDPKRRASATTKLFPVSSS